jgi:hypothetical protein
VPALRGDEDVVAVAGPGGQGRGEQALVRPDVVGAQAVGVGRVDERHPGVERGVDRADRLLLVGPAVDRQRHGAEADRADGAVSERALLHEVLLRGVSGSGECVPVRTVCRRAATST